MTTLTDDPAPFYLDTLRRVVSPPTASFHEEAVAAVIAAFLDEHHLPYTVDPFGNLIAHYHGGPAPRPLALMAHTDHPAFELLAPAPAAPPSTWTARLLGGVSPDYFAAPVPVRLVPAAAPATPLPATVTGSHPGDSPRDLRLTLEAPPSAPLAPGDFGIWDLPDYILRDGIIHARAIDDLAGCAAALLTLATAAAARTPTDLYAVFTRAEEVGLIGADLVFAHAALPPTTLVISLEASRTLPGAIQGAGPVIRVGDRATTFTDDAEYLLRHAATTLQATAPPATLPIQRQLMSGGRCEAGAALRHGYATTGLAFPLANYHNQGDHATLQPETIHAQDFLTAIALLTTAARLLPTLPTLLTARHAADTPDPAAIARLRATRPRFEQSATRHPPPALTEHTAP